MAWNTVITCRHVQNLSTPSGQGFVRMSQGYSKKGSIDLDGIDQAEEHQVHWLSSLRSYFYACDVSSEKKRKIWPKALPHYVLIFLCRHQEMYFYFVHLRSSCYIMPLFLLLISPSALTLSDLYFRNTSPGQKQYSNTSTCQLVVVGFLVPLTQFIFVFTNTSPAHKLLYRNSLCSNVAGKARPLSVIHGIMSIFFPIRWMMPTSGIVPIPCTYAAEGMVQLPVNSKRPSKLSGALARRAARRRVLEHVALGHGSRVVQRKSPPLVGPFHAWGRCFLFLSWSQQSIVRWLNPLHIWQNLVKYFGFLFIPCAVSRADSFCLPFAGRPGLLAALHAGQ